MPKLWNSQNREGSSAIERSNESKGTLTGWNDRVLRFLAPQRLSFLSPAIRYTLAIAIISVAAPTSGSEIFLLKTRETR